MVKDYRNGSSTNGYEEASFGRGGKLLAFGVLAVEKGLVTWSDIDSALSEQKERRRLGKPTRIGQILREKGVITLDDVTEIFELQGKLGGHTEIEGYEILSEIGRGGMGRIFKARQTSIDRIVALKIISPQLAMDAKYVRRFLRESKLAGKLRHHNIVFVLDAGISNGVHYYAMEYVKGQTLKEMLEHRSVLSALEIARLALHMTLALRHAHENGVVHRDIKPSNIIISRDRVPKLCDFGLAKDITFEGRTTTAGMVMGTPHYISPEQVMGNKVDIRSDIYSLGATLYHCACGDPPFVSTCDEAVLVKHITEEPEPLRAKRPAFSPVLGEILHRMMRMEPNERFQTPDELMDVLRPLAFEESSLWGSDVPEEW